MRWSRRDHFVVGMNAEGSRLHAERRPTEGSLLLIGTRNRKSLEYLYRYIALSRLAIRCPVLSQGGPMSSALGWRAISRVRRIPQ
jgi:hypothetical protein